MWAMLQQDRPLDFVLGTGESHTPRELVQEAFGYAGLDWERYVEIDPRYFRPTEVDFLQANPAKAQRLLGWSPKVTFPELVKIMVDADLQAEGLEPVGEGLRILEARFGDWHRWESSVTAVLRNGGSSVD
jgi:GDPmannose 4,6-dehydratase